MLGHAAPAPFEAAGRGPAVLALHGFTGSPSELGPLLEALARSGRAVRAPLLAGHGSCPTDLSAATFDTWLAAAREEAVALAARHGALVVVGFSLGSLVAMTLRRVGADVDVLVEATTVSAFPLKVEASMLTGALAHLLRIALERRRPGRDARAAVRT